MRIGVSIVNEPCHSSASCGKQFSRYAVSVGILRLTAAADHGKMQMAPTPIAPDVGEFLAAADLLAGLHKHLVPVQMLVDVVQSRAATHFPAANTPRGGWPFSTQRIVPSSIATKAWSSLPRASVKSMSMPSCDRCGRR